MSINFCDEIIDVGAKYYIQQSQAVYIKNVDRCTFAKDCGPLADTVIFVLVGFEAT